MKYRPEISFRCGPLALRSILMADQRLLASCPTNALPDIFSSPRPKRILATQVAALAKKVGLNYQMHFAPRQPLRKGIHRSLRRALESRSLRGNCAKRRERYLVEDPTFNTSVWATKQALEERRAAIFHPGRFVGRLGGVEAKEGDSVWVKVQPALSMPTSTPATIIRRKAAHLVVPAWQSSAHISCWRIINQRYAGCYTHLSASSPVYGAV